MSRRNRIRPRTCVVARPGRSRTCCAPSPTGADELLHTLKEFARQDGRPAGHRRRRRHRAREVLSALPAPPSATIRRPWRCLASGTTNPHRGGRRGRPRRSRHHHHALGQIARSRAFRSAGLQRRSTIEVSWPDGSRPSDLGHVRRAPAAFTAPPTCRTSWSARTASRTARRGCRTVVGDGADPGRGGTRPRWPQGEMMGVVPRRRRDQRALRASWMLATTLNKLMLGIWPFWGEGRRRGPLPRRSRARPAGLASALPAVLRGRSAQVDGAEGYRAAAGPPSST